jgi:hypothetical protein
VTEWRGSESKNTPATAPIGGLLPLPRLGAKMTSALTRLGRLSTQRIAWRNHASLSPVGVSYCALRAYATHNNAKPTPSSLLSEAFEQRQRAARDELRDSVGPMPMGGLVQPSRSGPPQKKWSELSTGGKGAHTRLSEEVPAC